LVLNVKGRQEKIAGMKSVYVVRELVSAESGEKELRTYYEYGNFPSYQAANQYAIATGNQSCFPQKDEVCQAN
jgi:hypothetical protein